jgi:hypothetical protein
MLTQKQNSLLYLHHIHLSTHSTNTENYIVHEIPTMFRAWIIVHDSVYPFVCVYIVYVFLACVRYLTISKIILRLQKLIFNEIPVMFRGYLFAL